MQALNDGFQVLLELAVVASLAYWGWEEGTDFSRWILAIGVPLAIAVVWATLVSRVSASKLADPFRLQLEILIFGCAVAALVRVEHLAWGILFALLAALQVGLTYVLGQR